MAGAGYKLFNTGDVLTAAQVNTYLQEQAVMRFANAAARTTALSGVLSEGMMSYLDDTNSVEVYNGSAWVSIANDPDAIQNTIVDAKGDIITATAADTPARLAVGTNDYVLMAASGESTGLKWGGAWTTWTPTFVDLTLGNGTTTARYLKIGKIVFFDFKIVFGSTTSISGIPSFDLPSTSKSDVFFFEGNILDVGVTNYGGSGQVLANTTRVYWKVTATNATYSSPINTSSTIPMTWGTNDEYQLHGWYEEA